MKTVMEIYPTNPAGKLLGKTTWFKLQECTIY